MTYVSSLVSPAAEAPEDDEANNKIKLTCSVALFNISLRNDAVAIFLEQVCLCVIIQTHVVTAIRAIYI